jgi:lactoylglutathione lyase
MFREPFPILHVSDVERAVALYTEAFGFEVTFRWPGEGVVEFAFLKLGDTGIGIGRAEPPAVPDWPVERDVGTFQLCVYTDDTAAIAEHLRHSGLEQLTAPREMPWGEKLAFFQDPDGILIHVTSVVDGDVSARLES